MHFSSAITGPIGAVLATIAAAALLYGLRLLVKMLHVITQLKEDFMGTASRPGVDAVPGVMVRLKNLDDARISDRNEVNHVVAAIAGITRQLATLQPLVRAIHHETQPNGGDSMKDQLSRVDDALTPKDED